ncbi:MAG: hypothetical protein WDN28_29900 [Chthoniobacter sp.]
MVNILVGLATLLLLYFAILRLFGNTLVAALLGASFVDSWYLMRQVSTQLMTEPIFILLEIPIVYCFLRYVREGERRWLWLPRRPPGSPTWRGRMACSSGRPCWGRCSAGI